jgi:hypothetical protein
MASSAPCLLGQLASRLRHYLERPEQAEAVDGARDSADRGGESPARLEAEQAPGTLGAGHPDAAVTAA